MLVALTRERGRNEALRAWVPGSALVVEIPLTVTHYVDADEFRAILETCAHYGSYRVLVVTSARSAPYVALARGALEAGATTLCVGPATADALDELGISCDLVGTGGALDVEPAIREGPVLLLGAGTMRSELRDALEGRALTTTTMVCYETLARDLENDERALLARCDVVFVGAPSAWAVAASHVRADAWVVVPGATTAAVVRAEHPRLLEGWNEEVRERLADLARA
ncbi:MAG: uroporphyrinogen-III synthase [Acidimicrobiales bacterium]